MAQQIENTVGTKKANVQTRGLTFTNCKFVSLSAAFLVKTKEHSFYLEITLRR